MSRRRRSAEPWFVLLGASPIATYYFECERIKGGYSGLFEYCLQLGNALERAAPAGDEIVFFLPERVRDPAIAHWRREPQRFMHRLFPVRAANAALWHSTHQATLYRPRRGTPVLLTVHDLNFLHQGKGARSIARNLRLVQRNIDRADHIVAISHATADDLRLHMRLGDTPVSVIHNGCDVEFNAAFDSPPYRPRAPFCFALGPTVPRKNFHVLPCLLRGNDLELIIAGKNRSEYAERIVEEARRHGVDGRVTFVGEISNDAKFWYYRHCEAFLFPSLTEGFGLPVIEAMTFGKRVFLSTRGSLPEIGQSHAYYFESFEPDRMIDAFSRGMRDELSPARKKAIEEHAASFNWQDAAVRYLRAYEATRGLSSRGF